MPSFVICLKSKKCHCYVFQPDQLYDFYSCDIHENLCKVIYYITGIKR